eukprot:4631791-Prymnesium_polylepis.1
MTIFGMLCSPSRNIPRVSFCATAAHRHTHTDLMSRTAHGSHEERTQINVPDIIPRRPARRRDLVSRLAVSDRAQ